MNYPEKRKPVSSLLDQTSLGNKGFIKMASGNFILEGHSRNSRVGKIAPSCVLG